MTQPWPAGDLVDITAVAQRLGVQVHDASRCTLESGDLYSYRRDGVRAGRFAGVIRCEYDKIGVRQCAAGRSRTSCGSSCTGRS